MELTPLGNSRIYYVEPNYVSNVGTTLGSDGLHTNEAIPSPENYSIYVNLRVQVKGRNINIFTKNRGNEMVVNYEDIQPNDYVSFLQGKEYSGIGGTTRCYLTTDYTETFVDDVKFGDNNEMFGIASIDIEYTHMMVPQIKIKFVDVRGISLFAPEENAHGPGGFHKLDAEGSFFKSFFTFPYPRYILEVKGFYGEPVSYELSCSEWKAHFDSSTGNFNVDATFVGFAYAFLADVMMNAITAAPYSDYLGSDYWKEKVKSGAFYTIDESGGHTPMKTLGKITTLIKSMSSDLQEHTSTAYVQEQAERDEENDTSSNNSDGTTTQNASNNQNDGKTNTTDSSSNGNKVSADVEQKLLSNIMGYYKNYMNWLNEIASEIDLEKLWAVDLKPISDTAGSGDDTYVRGVACIVAGTYYKSNADIRSKLTPKQEAGIALAWKNLNESIDSYNKQTGKNIQNTLPSAETISPTTIFSFKNKKISEMSLAISDDTKEKLKAYPSISQWLDDTLNRFRNSKYKDKSKGEEYDKERTISVDELKGVIVLDNGFYDTLFKINESINKDIENEHESSITEEQKKMIEALGFVPTIENIARIIMAHFETLIYMIKQTAIDIENDIENRTPESLAVDPKRLPDLPIGNGRIPPFPKVTEVTNKNTEGSYQDEQECWIGNLSGNWREEDLINGIINGINEFNRYAKAAEQGVQVSDIDTIGGVNTPMEYPTCPTDFIITGNPYGSSVDFSDFTDVVGRVGIRMVQLFGVSSLDAGDKAKAIGKLEAYNFAKLFPNPSKEFVEKLGTDGANMTHIFINLLKNESEKDKQTYGKKYSDTEYGYAWDNPSNKGQKGIFKAEGNDNFVLNDFNVNNKKTVKVFFTKSEVKKTSYYVPVQDVGFNELNSDMPYIDKESRKAPNSLDNYLATRDIADENNKEKVVPNVIMIDSTPERYENIINTKFSDEYSEEVKDLFKDFICTDYEDCYEKEIKYGVYSILGTEILTSVTNDDGTDSDDKSNVFPIKVKHNEKYGLFDDGVSIYNETKTGNDIINFLAQAVTTQIKYDLSDLRYFSKMGKEKYKSIILDEFCKDYDYKKYTVTIFPSYDSQRRSIFGDSLYYKAKSDEEKALVFLVSLKQYVDYDNCLENIKKKEKVCVFVPYCAILLAGAVLSVKTNIDDIKSDVNDWKDELKLLRNDVQNVFVKEFNKWVKQGFQNIKKLELRFKGGFPTKFTEMEDGEVEGGDVVKYFADNLENYEDFFANYVTVDEDAQDPKGFLLANRESGEGTKEATMVLLKRYAVLKTTKFINKDEAPTQTISISKSIGNNFINHFVDELKVQYGVKKENESDNKGETNGTKLAKDNSTQTNDEIRVGIYRYIKLLYDRWIAGDNVGDNFTVYYYFDTQDPVFKFIDTFYHKIGQSIIINIGNFADELISAQTAQQYSLLSMFGQICNVNKFLFFCINNFIDLSDPRNLGHMFEPISYLEMTTPRNHPSFIFNYTYEASSHLDLGEGSEYKGDSFMLTDPNNLPVPLQGGSMDDYGIPAFGVSYGKQYQSYFTDIDVSMDSPIATDQAIKAQYMIASMNNDNKEAENKRMTFVGQDLYTVYSNNSYTCTVKMMGCAWVQPLMYFCLTNVPLFRGTYQIMNVTHSIQPGNMTTTFKGVRMANVQNRKVANWCVKGLLNQSSGTNDMEARKNAMANYDNDCPYKVYPLFGGGKGGSIPQEDLMSRTIDAWNKYGWNVDKWKDASIESAFENQPLWETLCDIVYRETGGEYSGRIGNKIQAAFICNYWHHPNKKYSHGLFKNKKMGWYNEDYLGKQFRAGNYKKYKYWEDIKEVFFNGPASLIGQMTEVSYPVEIVSKYNHTGKKSSPVALTYDMLSKMTNYCTMCGWDPVLAQQKVCNGAAKENPNQAHWWGGEWLFQNKYHIYVNDGSIDHFWVQEPEIRNDKEKEKDELAKAFAKAVNQTCQNSGIGANVGIDEKNIANNTVRFVYNNDKSKLIGVFDVCLNSDYFNYVEELKWVIKDDNSSKENPEYIQVKVVEKTPASKIVGIYKTDGNNFNSKEVNEGYRKSVAKYLKNGGNASFIKTEIDSDGINITDCNSLVGKSDYGIYGDSAVLGEGGKVEGVDENATIGNWKVGLFVKQLVIDSKPAHKDGMCTGWVKHALKASGVKGFGQGIGGGNPWEFRDCLFATGEWEEVASGVTSSTSKQFNFGKTPQMGDICVMWKPGRNKGETHSLPGCTHSTDKSHGFHSCGYSGSHWYAGYIQSGPSPYGCKGNYPFEYHLLRHKA